MMVDKHVVRLQVIDFGSSCYETDQLYVYVQSRFYRAPEVSNVLGLIIERHVQLTSTAMQSLLQLAMKPSTK